MKTLLSIALLVISSITYSQVLVGNDLTIFTEDSEKFILFVNGKQINDDYQSSVTVENIIHNSVSIRIEFKDSLKTVITKRFVSIQDATSENEKAVATSYVLVFRKNKYRMFMRSQTEKIFINGSSTVIINN
jgi:hypothetical protein